MAIPMSVARGSIRSLFHDMKDLDRALGVKNSADGDLSAVNAHGHFTLFDQNWEGKGKETLIAYLAPGQTGLPKSLASTGEPAVHVRVDWGRVGSVRVENFPLPLIKTDFRIALLVANSAAVLVAFYGKTETPASQDFLKRWSFGDHALK